MKEVHVLLGVTVQRHIQCMYDYNDVAHTHLRFYDATQNLQKFLTAAEDKDHKLALSLMKMEREKFEKEIHCKLHIHVHLIIHECKVDWLTELLLTCMPCIY